MTGDTVTILAVTKNHPPEVVTEALDAGLTEIGENRVQEAMHKQEVLPKRGHWHLIGHLQTNKAKHAVEHFDLIESADSAKILTHLDRAAEQVGKVQDVLLQINEAGRAKKWLSTGRFQGHCKNAGCLSSSACPRRHGHCPGNGPGGRNASCFPRGV